MFKKANIPVYLDGVSPAIGKDKDGDKRGEVELSFRVHPLTPELAEELDHIVRTSLWKTGSVEISDKVKSVGFDLTERPQSIRFRAAPDATRYNIDIPYAIVSAFVAKKHKDVTGWALTFKALAPTPSDHELALLHHGYTKQHFLTFEQTEQDLIDAMESDDSPKAPPQPRPKRSGQKPESETPADVH